MSIRVTEYAMKIGWELLRATDPHVLGRKMPDASEVKFKVIKALDRHGDCDGETIRLSQSKHAHINTFLATLGHEAAHFIIFREGGDGSHGKRFRQLARRFCKVNGWDEKAF